MRITFDRGRLARFDAWQNFGSTSTARIKRARQSESALTLHC